MAEAGGNPKVIARSGVVIAVLLMLAPGGFFVAKGGLDLADRFSGREVREAKIQSLEIREHIANRRIQQRYLVSGTLGDGEQFEFDDERVYDLALGRTPLTARADVSRLTGRIIDLHTAGVTVRRVGGATLPWLAVFALICGAALCVVAFKLPWQTAARKQAREQGVPLPPPDRGALAMVALSAVVIVGGTLAWDLLR
jgi:hypothetical protein